MHRASHFDHLSRLLALESAAEAQRLAELARRQTGAEAERSGKVLVNLVIRDDRAALADRVILTLGKRDQSQPLPWNRLGVGTPVLLTEASAPNSAGWRGVVCGRTSAAIDVAFREWPASDHDRPVYRLDVSTDEISRQRQEAALAQARRAERGRSAQLRDVLLGEQPPKFTEMKPIAPLDPGLNRSQIDAVELALAAEDVAIIHGPPGTGKTTTVVELIRQAAARGEKVLACAPSNLAVDNLLERLVRAGERAVRLGHPARVLPELQEHTLDLLVDAHPDVALARKLVKEARRLRDKAARYTRAKPQPGAKADMRREARPRAQRLSMMEFSQ